MIYLQKCINLQYVIYATYAYHTLFLSPLYSYL